VAHLVEKRLRRREDIVYLKGELKKIKRPPRDFIKHAQEDQTKHPILKDNFGP
jgi:hypothetical protein